MSMRRFWLLALLLMPLLWMVCILFGSPVIVPAAVRPVLAAVHGSALAMLLLQLIAVLACARLLGQLFRRLHQPQVLGEMLAGIVLGPSVLGHLAPAMQASLFPLSSLGGLQGVSQVGLMLFMFLIGLELDLGVLREQRRRTALISYFSIITPFALGVTLAIWLYREAPPGVPFFLFALFCGAAMSVTAMPVLARILQEKGLLRTPLGSLAMACAAVNDVTAWVVLTLIAWLAHHGQSSLLQLLQVAAYLAGMVLVMRPLLARYGQRLFGGRLTQDRMALVLGIALLSALATEAIGIHALFGAFLAGAIIPRHTGFVDSLTHKLEDLTLVLLLPLFFAWSGLRTDIGLLDRPELWLAGGLILLVAISGKLGGTYLAARHCGMPPREAGAMGVLMNTRGLMELVILNVGLDIGVITPALFTMMAFMAIITTAMTSPLLSLLLARTPSAVRAGPLP